MGNRKIAIKKFIKISFNNRAIIIVYIKKINISKIFLNIKI